MAQYLPPGPGGGARGSGLLSARGAVPHHGVGGRELPHPQRQGAARAGAGPGRHPLGEPAAGGRH
eukprot:4064100-Lingulodinium_polyedra.AAC.1